MAEPYQPPSASARPSSPEESLARRRFWKRAIWASVALTIVPPLLGVVVTVIGMTKAFSELGATGAGDTAQLSIHIGEVLRGTALGLIGGVAGLVLLVVSIVRYRAVRSSQAAG